MGNARAASAEVMQEAFNGLCREDLDTLHMAEKTCTMSRSVGAEDIKTSFMYCNACSQRQQVTNLARFCPYCGARVVKENSDD